MIFRLTQTAEHALVEIEKLIRHQSPGRYDAKLDRAQIERALANPNFYLYLADVVLDGKWGCAGMASVFVQHNMVRTIAEVHDVVVLPEFRGQGIARSLMEVLHATIGRHAVELGQPIKLYLTSRPSRVEANNLYQKLGYTLVAHAEGELGTNLYKLVVAPT